MTIEYLPVGIACNLKCTYCYQEPMRDANNITSTKNWELVKKTLERHGAAFTLFGGEPLLAPIEHIEEAFKFGLEKFGYNGIQTNGTLITDAHIDLFQRYKVGVGISIDGPGELNSARSAGSYSDTLVSTAHVLDSIDRLCATNQTPSLIVTIHAGNCDTVEKVAAMIEWFRGLEKIGIRHINLHILEIEKGMEHLALTDEQNTYAFTQFFLHSQGSAVKFAPFDDIRKLLTEDDPVVICTWNSCDPLTTSAVQGVTANGESSNCGRTNKDGVNWIKADKPGRERYLVLHQTPQEYGGCKDCRFFIFCKGQCPGTAINSDWRNRTVHCKVWYALFELIERDIILEKRLPISKDGIHYKKIERRLLASWENPRAEGHGDSHGDSPHGDMHGDSNKTTKKGVDVTWLRG